MSITVERVGTTYLNRPALAKFSLSSKVLSNAPSTSEQAFLEISSKPPLERLREKILSGMKVTEEQIAQMQPEARQAAENEIQRRLKEALIGAATRPVARVDLSA